MHHNLLEKFRSVILGAGLAFFLVQFTNCVGHAGPAGQDDSFLNQSILTLLASDASGKSDQERTGAKTRAVLSGEITPLGPEFEIQGDLTSNIIPAAAMAPDGSYVIAWENWGFPGTTGRVVVARHFKTDGVPGATFLIPNYTPGVEYREPSVAMSGDGSFVISWTERSGGTKIYARRYDNTGAPRDAAPILISDAAFQGYSQAGMADDGSFAVAYMHGGWPNWGITVQFINANGSRGAAAVVPGATGLTDGNTPFSMAPDGSFVIAYTRNDSAIYARYWRGGALSNEIVVRELTAGEQFREPYAGMAADGSFTVFFGYRYAYNGPKYFHAARYDSSGNELYNKTIHTIPDQYYLSIDEMGFSMARNGTFTIAWHMRLSGLPEDYVFARVFNSDGTPLNAEFQVSELNLNRGKYYEAVGMNNGKLVVSWMDSYSGGDAITCRLYSLGITEPAAVVDVVNQMVADGLIANDGTATSVTSSLGNAQEMIDKGNTGAAANKLQATINSIRQKSGKSIDAEAAAQLIAYLESLIANL